MSLLIISASPRVKINSNTDKILNEFKKGYDKGGNTSKIVYLANRKNWDNIRRKFYNSKNVLIGIPLYFECIPGIMVEFLETLDKKKDNTRLGFILHGGFPEASQFRCGEEYLRNLASMLGCKYCGTLIRGGTFGVSFMKGKYQEKLVYPFYEMGLLYGKYNYFRKDIVNKFALREYYSKIHIFLDNFVNPFRKIVFSLFSLTLGCHSRLSTKPYQKYIIK